MTENEEIEAYESCLMESLLKLCSPMGGEPEAYDKDQSDFQSYVDCANDAAALILQLKKMAEIGFELAEYASYAEIIGAVKTNKKQIRNSCDAVFSLRAAINEQLENFLE